jgi:hypothetical protein
MPRGQQKIIVPREDLPPVSKLSDGSYGYVMRYRIVSEDQNRFSHWAPIRELAVPEPTLVAGDVLVNGSIAQVVWGDEEDRPNYDVFVKFDEAEYVYHGTTPTHQYSFILEGSTETIRVAIQIESTDKERAAFLTIFESDELDLVQLS